MFSPTLTLTVNNAGPVLEAGLRAIEAGETEIDLSQLTVVDSAAVATMLAWQRASLALGRTLTFRQPHVNLQTLSQLYGIDELLKPCLAQSQPQPQPQSSTTTDADLQHH
jgi:phospholipid transport system transporter-binding protein